MKVQDWIFSIRNGAARRCAVVGPARASTVEAALQLAGISEAGCAEIRACTIVHDFIDGRLDPDRSGYYVHSDAGTSSWVVCIGSVQEVLS